MIAGPGTLFAYGPSPFFVFGELLRRRLLSNNETVEQYLYRRLLDPIGLRPTFWSTDQTGQIQLPFGAFLTARQWAIFGEFLRLQGKWEGRQLIAPELLADCFTATDANPLYGLTFWLSPSRLTKLSEEQKAKIHIQDPRQRDMVVNPALPILPVDYIMAAGAGKQRLYLFPEMGYIIVRQGEAARPPFQDDVFLRQLLFD
jgi:CubicO group peptidase (beta-lactamase class C family)